jgi:hypothetical protein
MSTPWSQGGRVPSRFPEWVTLVRQLAVFIALALLGVWISGFRCARYLDHRPDPALAAERQHAKLLVDSLEAYRAAKDSLDVVLVVARAQLAVDSAQSVALHREASRRDEGLVIDTAVAAIALLPAEDPGSSPARSARIEPIPPDTVAYVDLQRPNDERHYSIPKFFAASYLAMRADRNGLMVMAKDQQDIIQQLMAKAAVADSMQSTADSLNASLARQVTVLESARHPRCGFKCGALTTLGVLTAAAITLHEVRR